MKKMNMVVRALAMLLVVLMVGAAMAATNDVAVGGNTGGVAPYKGVPFYASKTVTFDADNIGVSGDHYLMIPVPAKTKISELYYEASSNSWTLLGTNYQSSYSVTIGDTASTGAYVIATAVANCLDGAIAVGATSSVGAQANTGTTVTVGGYPVEKLYTTPDYIRMTLNGAVTNGYVKISARGQYYGAQ